MQGDGCGLGLAIVKEIVERHAGSVTLEGAVPRGLRVLMRLPLATRGSAGSSEDPAARGPQAA